MEQIAELRTYGSDRRIAGRRVSERRLNAQPWPPEAERRITERRIAERRTGERRRQNAQRALYLVPGSQNAERTTHSVERATHNTERKLRRAPSFLAGGIVALMVVLMGVGGYFVKSFLSEESPNKKKSPIMVTLMKPPPPPDIKEKLPEPEQIKQPLKEEIYTPPQDSDPGPDKDSTPAGDTLGVDAAGTAGGDAFGLVGKKGGRSLLAGEGGTGGMGRLSLLIKFAGYTHTVEAEIRKRVMKHLDQYGGIPKGKLQAGVRLTLDGSGAVVDYKIIGSSGNHKMDDAVK